MTAEARPGIALFASLVALAVVGILLMAGFAAVRADWVRGRSGVRAAQLDAAAAGALAEFSARWDSASRFAQPLGTTVSAPVPTSPPGGAAEVWVTRISDCIYRVTAHARDATDPNLAATAAMVLLVAAPVFPDSLALGVPPDSVGGTPLAELLARAERVLVAGATVAAPVSPLAVALGDLTLSGGSGRGVLVVRGRLTMAGPLKFAGVIFATGDVEVAEPGVQLTGALLSGGQLIAKLPGALKLRRDSAVVKAAAWHVGGLRHLARWR